MAFNSSEAKMSTDELNGHAEEHHSSQDTARTNDLKRTMELEDGKTISTSASTASLDEEVTNNSKETPAAATKSPMTKNNVAADGWPAPEESSSTEESGLSLVPATEPTQEAAAAQPRMENQPPKPGDENQGNNLFITSLSDRISDEHLKELFSKYGEVDKCAIMRDPYSKESRGFAFITMKTTEGADAAIEAMNGLELEGRAILVEKARRGRPRTPTPGRYYGEKRSERRPPPPHRGRGAYYEHAPRYDDRRYDDRRYDDRRPYYDSRRDYAAPAAGGYYDRRDYRMPPPLHPHHHPHAPPPPPHHDYGRRYPMEHPHAPQHPGVAAPHVPPYYAVVQHPPPMQAPRERYDPYHPRAKSPYQ